MKLTYDWFREAGFKQVGDTSFAYNLPNKQLQIRVSFGKDNLWHWGVGYNLSYITMWYHPQLEEEGLRVMYGLLPPDVADIYLEQVIKRMEQA